MERAHRWICISTPDLAEIPPMPWGSRPRRALCNEHGAKSGWPRKDNLPLRLRSPDGSDCALQIAHFESRPKRSRGPAHLYSSTELCCRAATLDLTPSQVSYIENSLEGRSTKAANGPSGCPYPRPLHRL